MPQHPRYRLSNAEKDALLSDQAVLIDALAARIRELEAKLLSPKKTSKNSHTPPSAGHKANAKSGPSAKKRPRPSRPGVSRKLAESPDEILRQRSTSCGGCGTDVSGQRQHIRHRYVSGVRSYETDCGYNLEEDFGLIAVTKERR